MVYTENLYNNCYIRYWQKRVVLSQSANIAFFARSPDHLCPFLIFCMWLISSPIGNRNIWLNHWNYIVGWSLNTLDDYSYFMIYDILWFLCETFIRIWQRPSIRVVVHIRWCHHNSGSVLNANRFVTEILNCIMRGIVTLCLEISDGCETGVASWSAAWHMYIYIYISVWSLIK